jgi:acyl-CoA synthetase (NDP forming)
MTGTGGAAAMVVDRLGVLGAEVVGPSAGVIANLAARDIHVSDTPLTDIPMGRAGGGRYAAILSELLASDHCDAVVAVIGSSSQTGSKVIVERVLEATHRDCKPLAVFLAPRADQGLVLLEANGIAGFRTPESCADAVNAYLNWSAPAPQAVHAGRDLADAAALVARAQGARLNESDSCQLFAALGINVAKSRVLTQAADCADMAGPVAVKILSADIPHKTDVGMVRLNVPVASVRREAERMLEDARTKFPAARIDGVLVQRMEHGIAEAIVGYRRDPEVGPVVLLGAGGTAAELRRSFCVRIAPVTVAQAEAMIDEVRDLAVLRGYRNLPRADCAALANAIVALSLLAVLDARSVSEAEINPLIVKEEGQGVVAVDGLVVFAP